MTTLLGIMGRKGDHSYFSDRARSRRAAQRAHRIFNGNLTTIDKIMLQPDKLWFAMIAVGILFVGTGVGFALCLLAESAV